MRAHEAQRARLESVQQMDLNLPEGFQVPSNSPGGEIQGGLARVRGLTTKPELNGTLGRLLQFDTRRMRFVFLPTSSSLQAHAATGGRTILVRPQNLEGVDSFPEAQCTADSAQFCAALQASLAAAGIDDPVVDLTPHIASFKEMLALYFFSVGNDFGATLSCFSSCFMYAQRTVETEPFFLFVRELTMSANKHAPVPAFLMCRPKAGGLTVPPGNGGKALDQAAMLRFFLSVLVPTFTCPVCYEKLPTGVGEDESDDLEHGDAQAFPCGHLICRTCLAKLPGTVQRGVTCPICRETWENWSIRVNHVGRANLVEHLDLL